MKSVPADQTQTDRSTVDQTSKHTDQQDVLRDRHSWNDIGEYTGGHNDQSRIERKAFAYSPKTEDRRDRIQCQTDRRKWQ